MKPYPIATDGIFWTVQGEGALLGTPMAFIRLAGCSVGCSGCDTNYRVSERLSAAEIVERLQRLPWAKWVWLTGGEPTDHDLSPLVAALHVDCYKVALATAGVKSVRVGSCWGGVDFLSVSPHALDDSWVQRRGDQVNVVPGLNGLSLASLASVDCSGFSHQFVTPCDGKPETLTECLDWVRENPSWRLNIQAHKIWRLP